jgi:uncharacterized damage-inducible protein DinB
MSMLARHRALYEYEKDCNAKMLAMLDSVPRDRRADARFQRAVTIAGHLAACRENWLDYMAGDGANQVEWWDPQCALSTLRPRFDALETRWSRYLAGLTDDCLPLDFEFSHGLGESFRLPVGVQIEQLAHHADYHRGQVALLVDMLGGEVVDTDYADFWWENCKPQAG